MKIKTLLSLFLIVVLFFAGCQKKEEPKEPEKAPQTETVTPPPADTVKEVPEVKIPDMVGTWTGTLQGRATTLKITEQTGEEFQGNITINYRNQVNQKVKGKINLEGKKISMSDQIKTRAMGTYSGILSEDNLEISGSFTQTVDNYTTKFKLKKK